MIRDGDVEWHPTDRIPRVRIDPNAPFLVGFVGWLAHGAVWFLPTIVARLGAHATALVRGRTAGTCPTCEGYLTWPMFGPRPERCPACGQENPCPWVGATGA